FSQKMGSKGTVRKIELKEHFIFWGTKLFYVTAYLIVPMVVVGVFETLIGYIVAGFVCGYSISIVFQLAHVVEGAQFPEPNPESGKMEQEWAVHQVITTANFATKSKLVSWFLGGLNFQVEHHLFPGISHIHYPQINKLVKETCREFNVAYLEHRTMWKAIISHLLLIKKLGRV